MRTKVLLKKNQLNFSFIEVSKLDINYKTQKCE